MKSIQFLIHEVYHVKGQLKFEGFDDMLKDTFIAACTTSIEVADYILHKFNLQFNFQDKKKLQRHIIKKRFIEAFKYVPELDLNATEMLQLILSETPFICCSEELHEALPEHVQLLYLLLEQLGANVAEIFRDFDIGKMLGTQPWFLLPGLNLLERHNISISAADASLLLQKTLLSMHQYMDRSYLTLGKAELGLLSHLVDKYGARLRHPFFPNLRCLYNSSDKNIKSLGYLESTQRWT
ncbi:hypothetical protein K7432_008948 [Basidiobolus ranarum]|uniref:Uncharacterized protein n=1 Tax=Basidiobolus ranarum TaxID=34480 RepID=A0ABR2VYL0_9FUNG